MAGVEIDTVGTNRHSEMIDVKAPWGIAIATGDAAQGIPSSQPPTSQVGAHTVQGGHYARRDRPRRGARYASVDV